MSARRRYQGRFGGAMTSVGWGEGRAAPAGRARAAQAARRYGGAGPAARVGRRRGLLGLGRGSGCCGSGGWGAGGGSGLLLCRRSLRGGRCVGAGGGRLCGVRRAGCLFGGLGLAGGEAGRRRGGRRRRCGAGVARSGCARGGPLLLGRRRDGRRAGACRGRGSGGVGRGRGCLGARPGNRPRGGRRRDRRRGRRGAALLRLGHHAAGHGLLAGRLLGSFRRTARPLAQPLHVPRLREVQGGEDREADNGRQAGVGADLLDDLHEEGTNLSRGAGRLPAGP